MSREGENGSYEDGVQPPPRLPLVAYCGRKIGLHADRQPQQGDKNRVRLVLHPAGPEAMWKLFTEDSEGFLEFNGIKMIQKGQRVNNQLRSLFGPVASTPSAAPRLTGKTPLNHLRMWHHRKGIKCFKASRESCSFPHVTFIFFICCWVNCPKLFPTLK